MVLSNYATADMRKRCAQLGADAVFDKSNEIDALVEYCIAQSESRAGGMSSSSTNTALQSISLFFRA